MKYLDIKLIEKNLQEDTNKYTVIVLYVDGKKYLITDILKKEMDNPRFADAIKKMAKRKFPDKQFKTFHVVGTDGKKIAGYDFEILRRDELDPDGVLPKKSDDKTDDKGEIKPEVKPEVKPEDEIEPETNNDAIKLPDAEKIQPNEPFTATAVSPNELAAHYYSAKQNKTIDKDQDGINDKTGEVLPLIYADGTLRDPENPEKVVGTVPGYVEPTVSDIEGGDSGSGEEGESGLTGEQSGSAPDIADEVYEAIDGMGTDETRLINALQRIETRAHLSEILKQYLKKYQSKMNDDIINDFKFDLGGFNPDQRIVIDEINDVMKKTGYIIYGNRFLGSMGWHDIEKFKIEGNYVGHDARPGYGWHMGVILYIGSEKFGIRPNKTGGYFGTKYGSSYQIGPVNQQTAGPDQLLVTVPLKNKIRDKLKSAWLSQELDRYVSDNIPDNGKIPPVKAGDPITKTMLIQYTLMAMQNGLTNNQIAAEFDKFPGGRDEMIGVPIGQDIADTINNYKGSKK